MLFFKNKSQTNYNTLSLVILRKKLNSSFGITLWKFWLQILFGKFEILSGILLQAYHQLQTVSEWNDMIDPLIYSNWTFTMLVFIGQSYDLLDASNPEFKGHCGTIYTYFLLQSTIPIPDVSICYDEI